MELHVESQDNGGILRKDEKRRKKFGP